MTDKKTLNMTQGSPFSLILRFALPLVLGSLLQQLYNFADTAIVGRCISAEALTAVGVAGSAGFMFLGFAIGSSSGFCIPISQSVGAGDRREVIRNFWNGLYLATVIGLVMSLGAGALSRPILVMMKTPVTIMEMADDYLTIIFFGLITSVWYNYFAGVMRALGDSKRPFYFLLVSSVLNVGMNLLLIVVIPMGVAGAALATVICQMISTVMCFVYLSRKTEVLRIRDEEGNLLCALSWKRIRRICMMGIPLGLQSAICSLGNVVLQGSVNTLGAVAAGAKVCGERIRSIVSVPMDSIGIATANFIGQNLGARNMKRIRAGLRSAVFIELCYAVIAFVVMYLLRAPLVALLLGTSTSPEAVGAMQYLTILGSMFPVLGCMMVCRNAVQGMGYSAASLGSSVMEIVGRCVGGLVAVHFESFLLICFSAPLAWFLALICNICLCAWYIPKTARDWKAKGISVET